MVVNEAVFHRFLVPVCDRPSGIDEEIYFAKVQTQTKAQVCAHGGNTATYSGVAMNINAVADLKQHATQFPW